MVIMAIKVLPLPVGIKTIDPYLGYFKASNYISGNH